MGKKYKYVYAEVLTGQLHLVEDHLSLGHSDEDCYQLKEEELDNIGTVNLAEPTLPPEDLSKIKWEQQY